MALVVGQNSWATRAEANSYLEDKINTIPWFSLPDDGIQGGVTKDNLLVSAFYWLRNAPGLSLPDISTDENVKNAQIEGAWYLYNYDEDSSDREAAIYSGLSSFTLSKRSENLDINNIQIPQFIIGILRDYAEQNTTVDLLGEYDV